MNAQEIVQEIDNYLSNNSSTQWLRNLLSGIKSYLANPLNKQSDKVIQEINLMFPNCDDGTILSYVVGKGGVTQIKEVLKNGEYAQIKYYEIWKDDFLYAELHHFTQIIYKK